MSKPSVDERVGVLHEEGKSLREISKTLGITRQAAAGALQRLGVPPRSRLAATRLAAARRRSGLTEAGAEAEAKLKLRDARICELYGQLRSLQQVAAEVGVCTLTVARTLDRLGVAKRTKEEAAISVLASKANVVLDEGSVEELRVLRLLDHWSWDALVERYGASKTALRLAVDGETWKHVPMPTIIADEAAAE